MGRLFWKLFFAFWAVLLLFSIAVATVLNIQRHNDEQHENPPLAAGPLTAMVIDSGAAVFQHGGAPALRELLADWDRRQRGRLYAVDAHGRELLGREVPPAALLDAQQFAETSQRPRAARWVGSGEQKYLLFIPFPEVGERRVPGRHGPALLPPPSLMLLTGVIASIAFAALLAWYLSRPIRHLRWAFDKVAQGKLNVRVEKLIGPRRDEIADLGRDFDRMAQRLQQLLEGQQRLLHDVSHELRSPLARLQAAVGLIRQKPARAENMLERIEREIEQMNQLVGELLTLSRLDNPSGDSAAEQLDVIDLIAAIAADARFEAQMSGRDVHFNVQGECLLRVHAEALQRAIENVVRNAVKHTAETTAVEIVVQSASSGKDLHISVCDRGPGVNEADLDKIFEPFYRGEQARNVAGFGLGLAIARRAVEADGGEIIALNRAGGGLCVEIRLPAHA